MQRRKAIAAVWFCVFGAALVASCGGGGGGASGDALPNDGGAVDAAPDVAADGGGSSRDASVRCDHDEDCATAFAALGPCELAVCDTVRGVCARGSRPEKAPCDDGDPCTVGSECRAGACTSAGAYSCDDGDPCTADRCDGAGGCERSAAAAGTSCDDGNGCTAGDACDGAGACVGADDGSCSCSADRDCAPFDDGNACNGALVCVGGRCVVGPGTVVVCDTWGDSVCTRTRCQPATGACVAGPQPDGTGCDDGDPCTSGDVCTGGLCEGATGACPCGAAADCAVFEDGDLCNGTLVCTDGACRVDPATRVRCADAIPSDCRVAVCVPATGACEERDAPVGRPCDDGDACTRGALCAAGGTCGGAAARSCDDGNPCTDDACDPATGCAHTPNTAPCEDGNACTVGDTCREGACRGGSARDCADDNPCTEDVCNADTGCVNRPLDGTPCDDGDPCTGATGAPDRCQSGVCVGGDPCRCASDADCAALEDGNPCNGTLHCVNSRCVVDPLTVVICPTDQDSACRRSTCAPATGLCSLQPVADGLLCDDGDPCTPADRCQAGVCTAGAPLDCGDGDPCTIDSCVAGQCRHDPVPSCGVELCATSDDCADDDPCTRDECGPNGACVHVVLGNGAACEDGDPCSGGDTCQAGRCVPGPGDRCAGVCYPVGTLGCGDVVDAATWDFESTLFVSSYACVAGDWSGPEMAYVFLGQSAGTVTARLQDGAGLGLFVLRAEPGCDPLRCVVGDPDGGPVSWVVQPGQAWFLVVDGTDFAAGMFTLTVSCGSGEDCGNGADDDGDGATDCDDAECASAERCRETACANGVDDDGDGATDCADIDCVAEAVCLPEGNCTNRVDDDSDGATDCADEDCAGHPTCIPETNCHNGSDDDLDGLTDCRDPDCASDPRCEETVCNDLVDNDGDGLTDCADDDCARAPGCYEDRCDNGIDDDRDGLTDCRDGDCHGSPLCVESLCGDGLDNDRDGLVDCLDPDCYPRPPCSTLCQPVRQLRCGELVTGQTSGEPRRFADYGACLAGTDLSGPELVYAFWPPRNTTAIFRLHDPDFDAALLRLEGLCRPPTTCTGAANAAGEGGAEELRLPAQIGTPIFVAVEGVGGDAGRFELTLGCTGQPERDCNDGVDDDGDGATDCDDVDCQQIPPCAEDDCTNGVDDNGDGAVDCADPSCAAHPNCGEFDCANGVDDDGDGATDCDDLECALHPVCGERCTNRVDDDDDGLVDCLDPDCTGDDACAENCGNRLDDEGDGLTDCADPECIAYPGCAETVCGDGVDDDGDGRTDCADLDCVGTAPCRETVCDDGVDDDGDGRTDCADLDCRASPLCFEVACGNGVDDDGDGLVDCHDLDCARTAACTGEVCTPARVLGCGARLRLDLRDAAATDVVDRWRECDLFGLDHRGAELAFDLPVPCTGLYTVSVRPTGVVPGYLDLLLLDGNRGCAPEACRDIGYGELSGTTLPFEALVGDRYTLVVDGVDGYEGPLEIELDCGGCQPLVETVCDDLVDEDGDLVTDCADEDCADAPVCQQTCRPRGALACGGSVAGTLGGPGSTDRNDRYPCDRANQDYEGPEDTWSFVSPCTGPVTVTTLRTAGSGNRDTFVLRADADGGCAPESCTAVGYMSPGGVGQVVFGALAGARYYVVVDSAAGPPASYTLSVTCGCLGETDCRDGFDNDGDGRIDCQDPDCAGQPHCAAAGQCSPRASLTCDVPVDGDTSVGGVARVDGWSCSALAEVGREEVYRWVAPRTGLVSAILDIGGGFDLDLFVLEDLGGGCNPDACIASSTRTGDEIATFVAIAGRTYYVVVDGYGNAAGPYQLQVDCSPGCEVSGAATCEAPVDADLSLPGVPDGVGSWRCDAARADYSGAEAFYSFELPCSGSVDVRVRKLGGGGLIDLVRLVAAPACDGSCAEIAKMDPATGAATLRVTGERGARMLFAVDGRDGFEGPFRLEFDCAACLSDDPCYGAAETTCGGSFAGTTVGAPRAFDFYGCSPVAWPGGEQWRRFVPMRSGPVRLTLSSDDAGLGVMLIEDSGVACDPFACVAGSDWRFREEITASVDAGQGYLVVVDGRTTEGATFHVDVECP
jgi:hypothetical protein